MLTVLAVLGVLIVIFVAAVFATREGGELVDAPADLADVGLPGGPLQPEDVHAVRFGVTVRGYRMSEVDEVLERVARELADRDERIALLVAAAESGPTVTPPPLANAAPSGVATPSAIDLSTDLTPLVVTPAAVQTASIVQTATAVPAEPVVPVEPPLDGPPDTLQGPSEPSPSEPEPPPVEVATVPVELAPLPDRSGDGEPAARD